MEYLLEKKIWTDADFAQMGWHDCRIYKLRLTRDLELDIDYIFRWNQPEIEGLPFTFWVAPATLVFKNVQELSFELNTAFDEDVEMVDIQRSETENGLQWTIITHQGDFEFLCDGFEQFIRQDPFFQFGQTIPFIERYGHSLERTISQENPNRFREDIVEQRKKDIEHFEKVKKRHLLRLEKEKLENSRNNNEIDAKQYFIRKREIKEQLDLHDSWLKDTKFENW